MGCDLGFFFSFSSVLLLPFCVFCYVLCYSGVNAGAVHSGTIGSDLDMDIWTRRFVFLFIWFQKAFIWDIDGIEAIISKS